MVRSTIVLPYEQDVTPKGLSDGGKISTVAIDNINWTPVPTTPLVGRNSMSIQNRSGGDIVLNYDPLVVGVDGVLIPNNGERQYDVTDAIIIYAKSAAVAANIIVEELA